MRELANQYEMGRRIDKHTRKLAQNKETNPYELLQLLKDIDAYLRITTVQEALTEAYWKRSS